MPIPGPFKAGSFQCLGSTAENESSSNRVRVTGRDEFVSDTSRTVPKVRGKTPLTALDQVASIVQHSRK
jgi:hypothetical protein